MKDFDDLIEQTHAANALRRQEECGTHTSSNTWKYAAAALAAAAALCLIIIPWGNSKSYACTTTASGIKVYAATDDEAEEAIADFEEIIKAL